MAYKRKGNEMGRLAKVLGGQCQPGLKAYKSGGKVCKKTGGPVHDDEAQDKALIKKMISQDKKKGKK